jgi:DNA polymerase-1
MIEERDPEETASLKTIVTEKAKYHLVNDEEQLKELIKLLHTQKEVCFDTETSSLDARKAELVGISFSFKSKEAFYVPIPESRAKEENRIHLFKDFFFKHLHSQNWAQPQVRY